MTPISRVAAGGDRRVDWSHHPRGSMHTKLMTIALASIIVLSACSSKPTAASVCTKLEAAGVAKNCRPEVPKVINARASEEAVFDLPAPAGKTGHVLAFAKAEDYAATVKAYEAAALLAGSHRYGSEKALIFVQLNSDASSTACEKPMRACAGAEAPPLAGLTSACREPRGCETLP
jgi:hypothetical protein